MRCRLHLCISSFPPFPANRGTSYKRITFLGARVPNQGQADPLYSVSSMSLFVNELSDEQAHNVNELAHIVNNPSSCCCVLPDVQR
jgi:hypothetical protein